jgi:hypothetical protein
MNAFDGDERVVRSLALQMARDVDRAALIDQRAHHGGAEGTCTSGYDHM